MVSSPDQRIAGLKIAGWALRILTVIILAALIIQAANFFLYLPNVATYSNMAQIVIQFVPLMVATGLLQWGSSHLFAQAEEVKAELEEKLAGYILSNQSMTIETISRWTGLPQKRAADMIALLVAQGRLSGYTIDLPSQTVFLNSAAQRPVSAPYSPPSPTPVRVPSNLSDEAVRIKAKLYELDMLKKQSRISEDEYNEMKGDLERKLVNLDTGTQVY